MIEGVKERLCNIYPPNMEDPHLFHKINSVLGEMEGQTILAGDFNEVMDPILDKSAFKGSLSSKGRDAVYVKRR